MTNLQIGAFPSLTSPQLSIEKTKNLHVHLRVMCAALGGQGLSASNESR